MTKENAKAKSEEAPTKEIAATELDKIKSENLSGRQLRIARKLAQRHGLNAHSDLEAVYLLRQQGVDPFSQQPVMDIGAAKAKETEEAAKAEESKKVAKIAPVPAKAAAAPPASKDAPKPISPQEREMAIRKIQRDLLRRRRRKLYRLIARITFFVTVPTLLAGYYFFSVATPMFATYSEFTVQKAESPIAAATGGLFAGSPFATQKEAISVQSYLTSRDAMLRLNELENLRAVYSNPEIDDLQRLEEGASLEEMYRMYSKRVTISFDPTDGILKMEVIAPSADTSFAFSNALLRFAEEEVDQMSTRARTDQMEGASESFEQAEARLKEASDRVLALQKKRGILSADLEITSQMGKITALETELLARESTLAELNANARPNKAKVDAQLNRIASLQAQIDTLRQGLTADSERSASLAEISGELLAAQGQLLVRQEMLTQSLTLLEAARVEANRQRIYLTPSVIPVKPDEAAYPKAFENTLVAGFIFAGIYLLISLTASILREQVTN